MAGLLRNRKAKLIFKNHHFWIITGITLVLILAYQSWPWRALQIQHGLWPWVPGASSLMNLSLLEIKLHVVGILMLIPILYATVVFKWWGAIIASLVSLASVLPLIINLWASSSSLITNIGSLLLPIIVTLLIKIELELRRQDKAAFIQRTQESTSIMLDAQEKERQRIAREIHDDTVQTLVATAKRAESVLSSQKNEDVLWIKNEIITVVDNLRRITLDLRPSILDDLGLLPAIRWLVDRTSTESGINIRIRVDGTERKLSDQVEIGVFRMVQEALNNIKYHSQAKEAEINLEFDTESLQITIQDNGYGISSDEKLSKLAAKGKQGLIGIRERTELLGGRFQIHSQSGEGTRLQIELKC